jgi:hypothetical protein
MAFEENRGQSDARARSLARGRGYTLFLTSGGAVLSLTAPIASEGGAHEERAEPALRRAVIRIGFSGASPHARLAGEQTLESRSNYLIGSDPSRWRTDVPHYAKVRYEGLYPGIDAVYYGADGQMEYDFVVAPGASPDAIRMTVDGADRIAVDEAGDLILEVEGQRIRQRRPVLYQEGAAGGREPVPGAYGTDGQGNVWFEIGGYDTARPLVIDPVLIYSTFLGGSSSSVVPIDEATNIALTGQFAVVVGFTTASDFPTTGGGYSRTARGEQDLFVTKMSANGSTLVFSTYFGGAQQETPAGIAVGPGDTVYVAGTTTSADYPTTAGAFDRTYNGGNLGDAFVTKLGAAGSSLVYSTFVGGEGNDGAGGVAVDGAGSAYVAGSTGSLNYPTTPGPFVSTFPWGFFNPDAFVTKLNAAGSALAYSTFLGGGSADAAEDIAVDIQGVAQVVGSTSSSDFPTVAALDASYIGNQDAFVTKLNAAGGALVYSTFLGGTGGDVANAVAVDTFIPSTAYVTGTTSSSNFPATAGAFDTSFNGNDDVFVTKIDPAGNHMFSTYLGGPGFDSGLGIVAYGNGFPFVTGFTSSANFPTTPDAFDTTLSGSSDGFVMRLAFNANAIFYSTFLGGLGSEDLRDIAVDFDGAAYVTGVTDAADYPTSASAFDRTHNGATDAVVTKLDGSGALSYSTYLGGITTSSSDQAGAVAVDASGAALVVGKTTSVDYPVTDGSVDPAYNGGFSDAFVTKVNAAGTGLVYSTYLGGASDDSATGVALDGSGAVYVAGETRGQGYPTSLGAYDVTHNGALDLFVTKLTAAGNALVYSTFLGSEADETPSGIAVDSSGAAYVAGITLGGAYPTTPGAFDTSHNGSGDAFVTKLNAAGNGLAYSTFVGGTMSESVTAIAVDGAGAAYVTGGTVSGDYPTTPGAFDTVNEGAGIFVDAFVTKVATGGNALAYSTYLGGVANDEGLGIAVDANGRAYVTGDTSAEDFPVTSGALDTTFNGFTDAFVTKLHESGASLVYSTFLGGAEADYGRDVAIGPSGVAVVAGTTSSVDFPTTADAFDQSFDGVVDAFVTKLNAAGTSAVHSTYLGGSSMETLAGTALSSFGGVFLVGATSSPNFPTTAGAFDTGISTQDGFVVYYCIGDQPPPDILTQPLNQTINRGQTATLSVAATSTSGLALSYQWYRGESGFTADPVAGATSSTFVTPPLQSTTRFWVRVSDACAVFRDSASALVTVNRAPVPVTSVADTGAGSLRQAIVNSNADPGTDTITFNLAAPYTINVASALPAITEAVILDGLTQPGAAAGHPLVVLAGPGAGAGQPDCANDAAASFDGLHFAATSAGSVVRGLVVNGFPGDGIELEGGGDAGRQTIVQSCFVGTNAAGTAAVINGRHGIYLNNAAYAVVGGDRGSDGSLLFGDLISGNHCSGVEIKGGLAANNTVVGCNVGPDVTGHFPIGNGIGIEIDGAPNTVVGAAGDDAGKRNQVAYNSGAGTVVMNTAQGVAPLNAQILGTTFSGNGGGAIVGGAPYTPSLASASIAGTTLAVTGMAGVPANRQYRVQYFTSTTCSGGGGQGEVLVAADVLKMSSPAGVLDLGFSSAATTARPGELVAVTVTGSEGTSNFSACRIVTGRLAVVAERAGTVTFVSLPSSGPGGAVEQGTPGGGSGGTPGLDRTFAGPRDPDDPDVAMDEVVPPDPQAAVGPSHLVAVTNAEIAVASKTNGTVARRVALDAMWAGLKRTPDESLFAFNPRATYDALGGRYVLVATANPREESSAVLVAVSKTTDPTGQWNVYRYDAEGADVLWADYPTLGYNQKWIAIQVNMSSIAFANLLVRSEIYLVDKAAAYAGTPGTGAASVLGRGTADANFGATQMPAVTYDAGATTLWLAQTGAGNAAGMGTIQLYKVEGAVGGETLSTGPAFTTTSTWFTNALPFADLAPQLGTAEKLQINDTRMQAVVYRNGRLFCAHTILLPAVGPTRSAVQWWEVNPNGPSGSPVQQGRVDSGVATTMYAHPSLAVSATGAMVVGYTRFTTGTFASSAYRYRAAGDAAGTLRGEVVLKAGEAAYVKRLGGSENRWGDYSSATVDPVEGERFWVVGEYAETARVGTLGTTSQWGVWVGSLTGAGAAPGADTAGIYIGSTGSWFLKNTNAGGAADVVFGYGPAGAGFVALRGDWNGDGVDTAGLYDPGTGNFFLKNTNSGGAADVVFSFGAGGAGVVPVVGDFDGNGVDTIGIYIRATGTYFLKNTNAGGAADVVFGFGPGGADIEPVFGDYDGNGTDTVGIYSRTTGTFFLKNTNSGGSADVVFGFGPSGAGIEPLVGDYDGNGTDTVGIYIASTGSWFLKNTNAGGSADVVFSFGPAGVKPLVGDWNGL